MRTTILILLILLFISSCGRPEQKYTNAPGEAVDLGLSVKWSSTNIGAPTPTSAGWFFSWGETSPKAKFHPDNGTWCAQTAAELITMGVTDSFLNLTDKYDAATSMWGNGWRMPTVKEFNELFDQCQRVDTIINAVPYSIFIGPNANSIILPYAGSRIDVTSVKNEYSLSYWTSTNVLQGLSKAVAINNTCSFHSKYEITRNGVISSDFESGIYFGTVETYRENKYLGLQIRPVRDF